MPAQYGTVVSFNPNSGWGFAQIDGTETAVLVHKNQKCRVIRVGQMPDDLKFKPCTPDEPKKGDELVLDTRPTSKGGKAVSWAFKREWTIARSAVPASRPIEPPTPYAAPDPSVSTAPKVDPPLTIEEMLSALGYRFSHAVLDAMENEGLAAVDLQNYVRHCTNGKKGDKLLADFHGQKKIAHNKKYGIAAFIRKTLEDAGFLVEL